MDAPEPTSAPRWRALERNERRVAGVLAEKAKTTPENYPLTLNSLTSGCNQKSNRFPQMQLQADQVAEAVESLRHAGAASLIQGDGRAEKYRHLLYEWLGVDKPELAVMTELLLRGAQTLGELRGRAARMEPIRDITDLQPIVDRLREKNLLIYLTPHGRGAVVTHNLYQPQELAKLRAEHAGHPNEPLERTEPIVRSARDSALPPPIAGPGSPTNPAPLRTPSAAAPPPPPHDVEQLKSELASLRRELAELREHADAQAAELRREIDDLKRQLGT